MNKKDKENKKKDNSTITFGRLQEVMQEESDLQRKKRGLLPEKIEPLISEKPEMKVKMPNVKESEEQENDSSTITFGELTERMQKRRDKLRSERGLPPKKIEPLISDKPEMKIKITNAKKPEEQQKVRRFFKNVIALVIVFILIAILVNTT